MFWIENGGNNKNGLLEIRNVVSNNEKRLKRKRRKFELTPVNISVQ